MLHSSALARKDNAMSKPRLTSRHVAKTRLTVQFAPPAFEFLRKEADRLGLSIPDVVRRAVDAHRDARGFLATI